jgi:hypothetical protein
MSAANTNVACEDKYRQMIDDVIIDELPPTKWEKLRKHLQVCPGCRARYNKAVHAERMLHGGPAAVHVPSSAEFDRIASAVLDPPAASEPVFARLLQWFTVPRATGLLAAAACLALIPILAKMNSTRPSDETFQPRGGNKGPVELFSAKPNLKPTERVAGLRAFCLVGDKVQALDPKGTTPPACERGAHLKLAVSNPGKYAKVFLVGMDGEHDLKWYAPRPPETESVPAPGPAAPEQTVDVPVGASVRLVVNHQPGPVRIYAIFSDKSVKAAEVQAAVAELADKKVRPIDAERLPLKRSDVLQRSLLIDVQQ